MQRHPSKGVISAYVLILNNICTLGLVFYHSVLIIRYLQQYNTCFVFTYLYKIGSFKFKISSPVKLGRQMLHLRCCNFWIQCFF